MLQLKFSHNESELDLPVYSLCEKKNNVKSCFVNNNRVDTVRHLIENDIREEREEREKNQKVLIKK